MGKPNRIPNLRLWLLIDASSATLSLKPPPKSCLSRNRSDIRLALQHYLPVKLDLVLKSHR
jgi:hypothetical protein